MKGQQRNVILTELFVILLLLYNIIGVSFLRNQYVCVLLFVSIFGILVYFKGFEKDKSEKLLDVNFSVVSSVVCYYMFIYVCGIFTGYAKPVYSMTLKNIFENTFPVILLIVAQEILRYQVVRKAKGTKDEKIVLFLLALLFILFDSRNAFPLGNDARTILDRFSLIIFPSVAKNIMYIYLMRLVGYKPVILYRLLMELPIYMVPIYPNFDNYITGILEISFPFIICLFLRNLIVKQRMFFVRETGSTIPVKALNILLFTFLTVMVMLTSGYFKYYLLGVVSESMNPVIYRGDAVIVKKLNEQEKKEIQVGEILVYRYETRVIVHRVVEKNEGKGYYTYRTKGDNNNSPDSVTIYEKDIIGVAKYNIPKIGYPSIWLSEWSVKK